MNTVPVILIAAVATQTACQAFKVVHSSIRERKILLKNFFQSGGMPSSHAAFVTALTVSVGIRAGWASDLLAVAAVFSFIIIHDAVRLRGTVEKHSRIIERLTENRADVKVDLPKTIGHNIREIAVGMVIGAICGAVIAYVL